MKKAVFFVVDHKLLALGKEMLTASSIDLEKICLWKIDIVNSFGIFS